MNEGIQEILRYKLDGFQNYVVTGTPLEKQLYDYKQELTSLAHTCKDIEEFYQRCSEMGFDEKEAQLHMDCMTIGMEESSSYQPGLPTVRDFLEGYRPAYNEIKKSGYRKKTEKIYEDLFQVAERTDNLVEAQLIIEKEGLVVKMVEVDMEEIQEYHQSALDPLDDTLPKGITMTNLERRNKYQVLDQRLKDSYIGRIKLSIATLFSLQAMVYQQNKEIIRKWASDDLVKRALNQMIIRRTNMKNILAFVEEVFGLTFDQLFKDQFIRISLLSPQPLCEFGRVKKVLSPDNLLGIEEIVKEEVITDKTMGEILLRKQHHVIHDALDCRDYEVTSKYTALALDLVKDIPYFKCGSQGQKSTEQMMKDSGVDLDELSNQYGVNIKDYL